jgi:hypothetical protein
MTPVVRKYRNKSKYHTNGREIQERNKIKLMVGKYRNKTKNHTNGREIQERK